MPHVAEMQNINRELFGLSKVSQKKGEIIENNVFDMFKTYFPDYALTPTNQQPHHGDAEVVSPTNVRFLLELKNYTNTVDIKEVNKLKHDMALNKIKYGLFVSIKSNVCGKKLIDYEKFDDDYYIVFISHVSDCSKIHAGLVLLDHIANLNTNSHASETQELEIKVRDGFEEMVNILDEFGTLKTEYATMEFAIRSAIDKMYVALRETELKVREKINKIWFDITNEINKTKISVAPKDKHHVVVSRLNDIFEQLGVETREKEENVWDLFKDAVLVGELKKRRVGVDIILKDPELSLRVANTDACYDTIKKILS
jgi:hypothetical protein